MDRRVRAVRLDMARPDPGMLDLTTYPVVIASALRFRDVDRWGHINNGAIADMIETARADFHERLERAALWGAAIEAVVAQSFDYVAEAAPPASLSIGIGVLEVGRSSWTIAQLATQHDAAKVFARCTLVHLSGGRALPITPTWRQRLMSAAIMPH